MGAEHSPHHVARVFPYGKQDALSFVVAGAILVRSTEISESNGSVDSTHNFCERDVNRISGKNVSAADAALGSHEPSAFEGQEDLFEVRLGKRSTASNVARTLGTEFVGMQSE